jgi:hypothetical protein
VPSGAQSLDVPICSSAFDVSEFPPSPTQNAADVVVPEQTAFGCTQLPETVLKIVPPTANPDQFELMSEVAAREGPATPQAMAAAIVAVTARNLIGFTVASVAEKQLGAG